MLLAAVLISAAGLTGIIRAVALKRQLLDIPNHRSSHQRPTPKGGGLAFVITFLMALTGLVLTHAIPLSIYLALMAGGLITAVVGYVDDLRELSPKIRIISHVGAAAIGLLCIGGMPPLNLGFTVWHWGWIGHAVGVLGLVWTINLYNFMDGIDGIAASEAVFASVAGGALLIAAGTADLGTISLVLAAACAGFLIWNWPPAKIFMGDTGSGFLGYMLGLLAIAGSGSSRMTLWLWGLLLGVFIVDTLVTLVTRVRAGRKWSQAHRSHAYQHLTIRWGSHLKVTLAVNLINVLWLLPLAVAAWQWPPGSLVLAAAGLVPLLITAVVLKAGQESFSSTISSSGS
ncbi:MAG: glycosyltransferase family 4 protein [Anaerolineae bacterium]|nr:glycosyltransferase family 4 protein [Anaerolineae bacterium]